MGTWTTTPRTWVAGEVPTATHFNENVRDFGRAFADAWTSYTPTLAGFTPGNGVASGAYMRAGKLIHFRGQFVFGSTSAAASAFPTLTLPVTALAGAVGGTLLDAMVYDASATTRYNVAAWIDTASTVKLAITGTSGVYTTFTTTTPFGATWTTSDALYVSGTYEAA